MSISQERISDLMTDLVTACLVNNEEQKKKNNKKKINKET